MDNKTAKQIFKETIWNERELIAWCMYLTLCSLWFTFTPEKKLSVWIDYAACFTMHCACQEFAKRIDCINPKTENNEY